MGKLANRKRFISIALIVLFSLFPYVSILMMHNITLTNTVASLDAGFWGDESFNLLINGEDVAASQILKTMDRDMGNRVMVYNRFQGDDIVKGIYFHKNNIDIPMLEGRFLKAKDFGGLENVAVVGQAFQNKLYQEKGKKYLNYQGTRLLVVGVMGMESSSSLDNQIFINPFSDWANAHSSTFYTIDCFFKDDNIISTITSDIAKTGDYSAELLSVTKSLSSRIVPKLVAGHWFAAIIGVISLCILLISLEWKAAYLPELLIKRLVGFSPKDILMVLLKMYGLPACVCSVLVSACAYVLFPEYGKYLVMEFVIIIVSVAIMMMCFYHITQKAPLTEVLQ